MLKSITLRPFKRKERQLAKHATIYRTLPEGDYLRVLKLHPGSSDEEIRCDLETVALKTAKKSYEAISYVWGDIKETTEVICNGVRIHITVSLADALRTFRDRSEVRVLWADALCINQEDDQERGHQVGRMGMVFANATSVLVWLGHDEEEIAQRTFEWIRAMNEYFGRIFEEDGFNYRRMRPVREPYPVPMDASRWSGLRTLLRLPWFSRVWTVQEAAVARSCYLYWGMFSVDIADVFEICTWCRKHHDLRAMTGSLPAEIRPRFAQPLNIIRIHYRYDERTSLRWHEQRPGPSKFFDIPQHKSMLSVLTLARGLRATDHRDHVYAFLGCPYGYDEDDQPLFEADYNMTTDDLYVRVAYALLNQREEGHWVLSKVTHEDRNSITNLTTPSWAPRWDQTNPQTCSVGSIGRWYRAGGDKHLFEFEKDDNNVLTVKGVAFDEIVWLSHSIKSRDWEKDEQHRGTNVPVSAVSFIDHLWQEVCESGGELPSTSQWDDFTLTLVMGDPFHGTCDKPPFTKHVRKIEAYRRTFQPSSDNGEHVSEEDHSHARSIVRRLRELQGRRLFLTKEGRFGLAPSASSAVGDVCCVVWGVTVPLLLTPAEAGRHKLVGECYVQGVMDGELQEQYASGKLNAQDILIA